MPEAIEAAARRVLKNNHRVSTKGLKWTLPSSHLYPHQWNWDSAFAALGWATIDQDTALCELESLVSMHNTSIAGLIPHIAFSPDAGDYMPGPDLWQAGCCLDGRYTSGISQPAIAGTVLRLVISSSEFNLDLHRDRIEKIVLGLSKWHQFLMTARTCGDSPDEPVVVHPWESGRDNAPEWDAPLMQCPDATTAINRVDTKKVSADERPTNVHYQKYLGIVEWCRTNHWDQKQMAEHCPFRVLDSGFSAILGRACVDLAHVANLMDQNHVAEQNLILAERITRSINSRSVGNALIPSFDLNNSRTLRSDTCGSLLPVLLYDVHQDFVSQVEGEVTVGSFSSPLGVRSVARTSNEFDSTCYWRGPVWNNITWLVALGLLEHQRTTAGINLMKCIGTSVTATGWCEYVDPDSMKPLGASTSSHDSADGFTWTAATLLDSLRVIQDFETAAPSSIS